MTKPKNHTNYLIAIHFTYTVFIMFFSIMFINDFNIGANNNYKEPIIAILIIQSIILINLPLINFYNKRHVSNKRNKDLSDDEMTDVYWKIIKSMEIHKFYLQPDLTIKELSNKIDIPYYNLSKIINSVHNKNFNDFVNNYRIEEAKKRFLNGDFKELTIEAISKEVGFNSQTVFYRAFKKYTNKTPLQFINSQNMNFN